MLTALRQKYGQFIAEVDGHALKPSSFCHHIGSETGVSYYTFPTVEALAEQATEAQLRELGFGSSLCVFVKMFELHSFNVRSYRAPFIVQTARLVLANGGRNWLLGLRTCSREETRTALLSLFGANSSFHQVNFFLLWLFVLVFTVIRSRSQGSRLCGSLFARQVRRGSSGRARVANCH